MNPREKKGVSGIDKVRFASALLIGIFSALALTGVSAQEDPVFKEYFTPEILTFIMSMDALSVLSFVFLSILARNKDK